VVKMILWKVQIWNEKEWKWITIARAIRFDYYSSKACKNHIRENYPDIAKQVEGKSWDVEVEKWE